MQGLHQIYAFYFISRRLIFQAKKTFFCIVTHCIALRWIDLTQVIKGTGSLQRLLIYQSAVFLPGHAVSSSMQAMGSCHNVVKEPICTLPGSHLHLINLHICK